MDEIDVKRKAPNVWIFERDKKGTGINDADLIRKRRKLWEDMIGRTDDKPNGPGGGDGPGGGGGPDGPGSGGTPCDNYDFNNDFNEDFDICWEGESELCGDYDKSFSSRAFYVCDGSTSDTETAG